MSKKIFISYRSLDRNLVEGLISIIKSLGDYDVWYDQHLQGGQKWWDTIMAHLLDADIVILALSNAYLDSEPCRLEREYAKQLDKVIIPIRIDDTLQDQRLDLDLAVTQYIRYEGAQSQKPIDQIRGVLANAVPNPLPSPLPSVPPTPISPLPKIRQDMMQGGTLSYDIQKELFDQLRWYRIEKPLEQTEVDNLLTKLKNLPEVSNTVRQQIVEMLNDEPSSFQPNQSSTKKSYLAPLIAVIVVVVIIISAVVIIGNQPDTQSQATLTAQPTDRPEQQSPTNYESGAFDITFIYGGTNSFTLVINEDSKLYGLTLETVQQLETIADSFPDLSLVNFIVEADSCLRYIREGEQPVLTRRCNPDDTLEVTLADADVFWYSDADNQYANVAIKQDSEVIRLCSHDNGSGSCDVTDS